MRLICVNKNFDLIKKKFFATEIFCYYLLLYFFPSNKYKNEVKMIFY